MTFPTTEYTRPRVLAVLGPTASGKSALAIALAKRFGGEIISCDSMQLYRGMDIGTAKATLAERASVPHHMIDVLDPSEKANASDYGEAARRCVREIISRGNVPIFCGGTGLYFSAAIEHVHLSDAAMDEKHRAELYAFAEKNGAHALHERLRAVDPESADAIHENNVRRVVRALEIYDATGIPKSISDRASRGPEPYCDALAFGIRFSDRAVLYARIDARVDEMIGAGLEDEVRALLARGLLGDGTTAGAAIGYKEYALFLRGACSREEAIARIKQATRNYAKRQITWFEARREIVPAEALQQDGTVRSTEALADEISPRIEAFGFSRKAI